MKENNKNHFNKHEFIKVNALTKYNPYEAKEEFIKYLEKYPNDLSAYTYYAHLLISLKEFDEAEKILNSIEDYMQNNSFPNERKTYLRHNIIFNRLRLLGYQERYDELLELYFNNYYEMHYIGNEVDFYYRKLANKLDLSRRNDLSYILRQVVEYQEDDFLNHLRKHLSEYNQNNANISKSFFSYDFPIDKILEEVKKTIPNDKNICTGFIEDVYVFKYDGCGRDNNKLVDYFRVICFHNTQNIITMCPSSDNGSILYTDLNYLREEKEQKVKKISQIDKFNRRYNR